MPYRKINGAYEWVDEDPLAGTSEFPAPGGYIAPSRDRPSLDINLLAGNLKDIENRRRDRLNIPIHQGARLRQQQQLEGGLSGVDTSVPWGSGTVQQDALDALERQRDEMLQRAAAATALEEGVKKAQSAAEQKRREEVMRKIRENQRLDDLRKPYREDYGPTQEEWDKEWEKEYGPCNPLGRKLGTCHGPGGWW